LYGLSRFVGAAAALLAAAIPRPAPAVIHEIVAAWCSGHGALEPGGLLSGPNMAQPLFAGAVITIHPYAGDGVHGPGLLIDFDRPQVKIIPTGQILFIRMTPNGALYREGFILDPNFPAFAHCAPLQP
jgi:hypothetical protein